MKKYLLILAAISFSAISLSAQNNAAGDWAQFGRYAAANSEVDEKPYAVLMGDSITDAWDGKDPEFLEENNILCRGISGQNSSQMLVRFRRDVLDLKPEAVAILAGINDIAQNNGEISLENTFGNIVSMCELAKAHKIKVILCSVLPCDRLSWRPSIQPAQKVKRLNAMLKEYAEGNRILFVDYWTAMANGNGGLDKDISKDGCHPTIEGYRIMEDIFLETAKKFRW